MVTIFVNLEGQVGDDAEIARTAAEHGPEQVRVGLLGDFELVAIVIDHLDSSDVVAKQAEGANELTIAACLAVTTNVDFSALPVRNEQSIAWSVSHQFVPR